MNLIHYFRYTITASFHLNLSYGKDSMSGLLFVVSAASGTGKTSLVKSLLDRVSDIHVSISHTTRKQRPSELHGIHYHFTTIDSFLNLVNQGGFIEYAEVFGNYYGTSEAEVKKQLAAGHDVLLEIDWQGAEQVRRLFPDSIQIFIVPPSQYDLRERLSARAQDSLDVIEQRLAGAITDMQQYVNFDYLVINDVFDRALHDIESIIHSCRLSVSQQATRHQTLIAALLTPKSD